MNLTITEKKNKENMLIVRLRKGGIQDCIIRYLDRGRRYKIVYIIRYMDRVSDKTISEQTEKS